MGRMTNHDAKSVMQEILNQKDVKTMVALLAVELAMLLVAEYKQVGRQFLPVTLLFMLFSIVGCIIAFRFQADRYLLIIVLVLMNIGFLVQQIHKGPTNDVKSFVMKLLVAFTSALVCALVYDRLSMQIAKKDLFLWLFLVVQYGISILMFVTGKVIGGGAGNGQSATISLFGITAFELVKVLYLFVAVALLCWSEDSIQVFQWRVKREQFLILHTAILSLVFVICNELGTLLIIYVTGLFLLCIYGNYRKFAKVLSILSAVGYMAVIGICSWVIYPSYVKQGRPFTGVVGKLVSRFGTVFHPEEAMQTVGYQGTLGLEALAMGEWLGIRSERYRLPLPEATNDFVFDNVIQTGGLLMGLLLLLFYFALLKRGMDIAKKCHSIYFQGLATAITIMIVVEAIIHIGYNVAIMPITGIPMYFVSQGVTAILTGMMVIAILLVISVQNNYQVE